MSTAQPPDTAGAGRRRSTFHPLTVREVHRLTPEAVEVVFALPDGLVAEYDYLPGQHIAVRHQHDGREIRRSYSLCAPPGAGELRIAVKAEPGGIWSTYATTQLQPGDVVDVMTPQGSFVSRLPADSAAHVAAVAAGSGITPVMALAASVLAGSPRSRFTLVYASRSAEQVMFVDALADLKDRYPARFVVHHVLSREQRLAPVHSGRLEADRLDTVLDRLVRPETVDEWFLCGPTELVSAVRTALLGRGSDPGSVHTELFTTGEAPRGPRPAVAARADGPQVRIALTLDGRTSTVETPLGGGERILDAALRSRSDVPFACAGGVCGTCRAKLCAGTVEMAANYALEPDELDAGYILTCQAEPTSDAVTVDYDG